MATEAQYEFFKFRYMEGIERYQALIARGQIFLSIVTLYIGVLSFKLSPAGSAPVVALTELPSPLLKWLYCSILISLLISLLLVILALGIYKYHALVDPIRIIEGYGPTPPTDQDFWDERIANFASVTHENIPRNNKRAKLLYAATIFLFLAALQHVLFFVCSNWR
jgi:hypothetical protein